MAVNELEQEADNLNPEDTDIDLFELAFNEAEELEPEEPKEEGPKEEGPKEEGPKEEGPKPEEPKPEEPKPEEPKPEEPKPEEPKEEEPKPKAKTEAEIRAEVAAELKAEAESKQKQKDESAKEELAKKERESKADLSDDDKSLQEEVAKDFPDVVKAMEIQKRVLSAQFENKLVDAVADIRKEFQAQMAPAIETSQVVAKNAHEAAILKEHEDAFTILPKVVEWVGTQPEFLQVAYNNAIDKGTAKEVNSLFTIYKDAQGLGKQETPGETPEAKAAREAKEADEAAEKKRKLDSQEGVRTRSAQKPNVVDENDFEGAFDAAASKT